MNYEDFTSEVPKVAQKITKALDGANLAVALSSLVTATLHVVDQYETEDSKEALQTIINLLEHKLETQEEKPFVYIH